MVSLRFKIFVHAIIFMLLHFVAYSLQDTEKMVEIARDKIVEEGLTLSQQEKDIMKLARVNVEVVVKHTIIGGRKMLKNTNEEHINVDEVASSSPSSINTSRIGGRKMAGRTKKIHHQHHDPDNDHEVDKMSSNFMALNAADYHVPRSHPPRNN